MVMKVQEVQRVWSMEAGYQMAMEVLEAQRP